MRTLNNFINGQWREPSGTTYLPDINPADTKEVVAESPSSTAAEATLAVEAAERAYPDWRATPAPQRGQLLYLSLIHISEPTTLRRMGFGLVWV